MLFLPLSNAPVLPTLQPSSALQIPLLGSRRHPGDAADPPCAWPGHTSVAQGSGFAQGWVEHGPPCSASYREA